MIYGISCLAVLILGPKKELWYHLRALGGNLNRDPCSLRGILWGHPEELILGSDKELWFVCIRNQS